MEGGRRCCVRLVVGCTSSWPNREADPVHPQLAALATPDRHLVRPHGHPARIFDYQRMGPMELTTLSRLRIRPATRTRSTPRTRLRSRQPHRHRRPGPRPHPRRDLIGQSSSTTRPTSLDLAAPPHPNHPRAFATARQLFSIHPLHRILPQGNTPEPRLVPPSFPRRRPQCHRAAGHRLLPHNRISRAAPPVTPKVGLTEPETKTPVGCIASPRPARPLLQSVGISR